MMLGLQILLEIVRETEDFHKEVHYSSNFISMFVFILGLKCELKQLQIKINLAGSKFFSNQRIQPYSNLSQYVLSSRFDSMIN